MSDGFYSSSRNNRGDVTVNGRVVDTAIWANTKAGLVGYVPKPLRINRRKQKIYTRILRGNVEFKPFYGGK